MTGRLTSSSSAYLRQHAGNPVDWWPFVDAAFDEARRRDVPLFVSVGYAACHWCHVMAHESFEDQAIADYLNQHFVSIKVDREERPDVDAVYMAATQAITGEGGWPMSVFVLPDGRAFYAGTYYPPQPVQGRPSFRQVLEAVDEAWRDRRSQVEDSAAQLAQGLAASRQQYSQLIGSLAAGAPASPVTAALLSDAVRVLARDEDTTYGGFGNAPKFPPSSVLQFLLGHAVTGAETAGLAHDLADRTLTAMATSALFDQLEGGFARYAVDRQWSVPHFEKMLYDNAQLLRCYTQWSTVARSPEHRALAADAAGRTADWMLAALRVDGAASGTAGGFASSLDADTVVDGVHHEGATYLWSRAELQQLLPDDGDWLAGLMGVDPARSIAGGKSALHPGRMLTEEEQSRWERLRPVLAAARADRPQPARDDKIVAGWNGLAIAALAEAAVLLDRPDLLDAADAAAEYLVGVHCPKAGSGLYRVSFDGKAQGIGGLLEDYAFCAEGFFALYAAGGDQRWYKAAERLVQDAVELFVVDGRLRDSAGGADQVAAAQGNEPGADPMDGATPSPVAAFAGVLLTYSAYSGSSEHRRLAELLLSHIAVLAPRVPRIAGKGMAVAQAALLGPVQIAVVGADYGRVRALLAAARRAGVPGLVAASQVVPGEVLPDGIPLLEHRRPGTDGGPLAYVCRGMVCAKPAATEEELRAQLRDVLQG
jgi:uncharacterized protein